MSLEQKAQQIFELRERIRQTTSERDAQVEQTKVPYNQQIKQTGIEIYATNFSQQEVESYLAEQGFERVESIPWYLDMTRGVSKRLQKTPTYWREVQTPEGKKEGLVFRVNNEKYELRRSDKARKDKNVLSVDPKRYRDGTFTSMISLVPGSIFAGIGFSFGGIFDSQPLDFYWCSIGILSLIQVGISFYNMDYEQKHGARWEASNKEALIQLYKTSSPTRTRSPS